MSHGVAISNMNPMGGSMGNAAPIPMMNNGTMVPQPTAHPGVGASAPGAAIRSVPTADRSQLNKYIYDYFLQNHMWDCARALLSADNTVGTKSENGKSGATHNHGVSDDAMDTDNKDDIDQKAPEDLPAAAIGNTAASDSAFLYDWFCLFWDMYHAQRHKNGNGSIHQYVSHTQAQSRLKQSQQQEMLRQMRPDGNPISMQQLHQMQQIQAMRMQNNGPIAMNMKQGGNLARTAMANNQNPQQAMQMMHAKHGQRDTAELEAMRQRASSPGSENAASPSKRPRLEGAHFNPTQPNMIPNGRPGGQGMPGQAGVIGNPNSAHAHALMAAGISPQSITPTHMQNFAGTSQGGQAKSIQSYSQNLQQHHGSQMPNKSMANAAGPPTQGSPGIMSQTPEINAYYNAPGTMDASGRMGPNVPGGAQPGGNNHALQDYQMQLMLLEQQNKKRLLMARQEQDNIGPMGRDGSGGPTPGPTAGSNPTTANAQFSDASQVVRPGASPNSTDQMKRGTPQMNNANMPSPLPDGAQSRGSPNSIPFNMNGPIDPVAQQSQQQFNMMQMANGMRPPSSHPNQSLNGAMTPQQQMMARQQQPQQPPPGPQHTAQPPSVVGQNGSQGQWSQGQGQGQNPGGPNGVQMTPQQPSQNQIQGTPQARSMAPPPPSAAGATNTSPALSNRPPTPKTKRRDGESKGGKNSKGSHIQKKTATSVPTRPAGEGASESDATPATPITPANPGPFPKAGTGPNVVSASVSGQAGSDGATVPGVASAAPVAPQHPDPSQGPSYSMDNAGPLPVEFPVDFGNGLSSGHMMEDFDFESFLHDDNGESNTFDFNATFTNLEGNGEIGTSE